MKLHGHSVGDWVDFPVDFVDKRNFDWTVPLRQKNDRSSFLSKNTFDNDNANDDDRKLYFHIFIFISYGFRVLCVYVLQFLVLKQSRVKEKRTNDQIRSM